MCFCAASTCACRVVATVVVVTRALLDQLSVGTSPASRLLVPVPREGALLRVLPVASSSCPYVQYEPIRPVGPAEVVRGGQVAQRRSACVSARVQQKEYFGAVLRGVQSRTANARQAGVPGVSASVSPLA